MDADSLIDSGDAVKDVLGDDECQSALRKGLKELVLKHPVAFYKLFVMPRMPKFKEAVTALEFEEMTPEEMDAYTTDRRKAGDAIFADIARAQIR